VIVKRGIDIVGAVVVLAVAAVPMAVIAVAIRATMGSPVLFRQQRPGLGAAPFTLIKFRTMRAGDDADALRLTRLGRFLRATSLDELPEMWNVLRGDMSLVGPRPLLMSYLGRYSPEQARRHEVRPGVTGLAQVEGRNATTWPQRLALDVRYVDERSLGMDLRILWRTVAAVVRRRGISADDHATMPEFRGGAD
jgi:lipopolysaccharide/colanic/teichoic acid biosynthesis glycosyltransferase